MVKKPLTPCQACQRELAACRDLLAKEQGRSMTSETLLREAQQALGEGAAALRKGASDLRVQTMTRGGEPSWLVKDFNVLYRVAQSLLDALPVRHAGESREAVRRRQNLAAQLERLKPAFTDTEEVRALMRERQGS